MFFACKKKNATPDDTIPPIQMAKSSSPIELQHEVSFYENIEYGEKERNKFDFFAPLSDTPMPLLIYIHGGGFSSGDKSEQYTNQAFIQIANNLFGKKIALANINYSFIEFQDGEGLWKSLQDCKKALQYIKYFSAELNINKNKIVLMGSSAGAGTSLWFATSDDMASPESTNPILRESTLVQGAICISGQSSYDLFKWHNSTFYEYQDAGMNLDTVLNLIGRDAIMFFYGVSSWDEIHSPRVQEVRNKLDFMELISEDDPELFFIATEPYSFPTSASALLHHPLHAKVLSDKAKEKGVPCKAYIPEMSVNTTNGEGIEDFIYRLTKD